MYKIKCPYCGHEQETEHDGMNEYDEECYNCEKDFHVYVEFEPSFSVIKIEESNCPNCDRIVLSYEMACRYPRPSKFKNMSKDEYIKLCHNCYCKEVLKDLNE